MKVRLVERFSREEQLREWLVQQEEFLIGRGRDCDLRLADSTISRHHCIVRPGTAEATLVDLGSANGTFLNGQRVRSQAALHTGDEIQVGSSRFVVILGEDSWTDPEKEAPADPLANTFRVRNHPPK